MLLDSRMKEGKKLKMYNDFSKTPVKKRRERQRIISVEKLIEN